MICIIYGYEQVDAKTSVDVLGQVVFFDFEIFLIA